MPRACATAVPDDETQEAPLCALWMASLGLAKLRAASALSSGAAFKYLLVWALVDTQARVSSAASGLRSGSLTHSG